jgi:hypothetical protein
VLVHPTRFASHGVAVKARRQRRALAVAALISGLPVALALVVVSNAGHRASAAYLAAGLAVVVASVAVLAEMRFEPLVSAPPEVRAPAELAFLPDGSLTIGWEHAQRRYPPHAVLEGWVEDFHDLVSVVLRTRGDDLITVTAAGADEARALLAAAGVSAEQRALRIRLGGGTGRVGWLLPSSVSSLALLLSYADFTMFLVVGATLVLLALLFPWLTRGQVVVGTDGLTLERPLVRRFIPFHAVTGVVATPGAVLVLTATEELRLPTGGGAEPSYEQAAAQAILFDRIQEARRAHEQGASASMDLGALDRRGRSLADWRAALRRLGGGESSYRRRVVPREALEAVLGDAAASTERRIGAAMALGGGEAGTRLRIDRAVAACADERLRAALAAAATDAEALAEEEIEAALDAETAGREAR